LTHSHSNQHPEEGIRYVFLAFFLSEAHHYRSLRRSNRDSASYSSGCVYVGGIKDLSSATRPEGCGSPAVLKPLPAISLDPDLLKAPGDSNLTPGPNVVNGGKVDEEALIINMGVKATSLEEESETSTIDIQSGVDFPKRDNSGKLSVDILAGGITKSRVHVGLLDTKKTTPASG
jgi:hypothetical protein